MEGPPQYTIAGKTLKDRMEEPQQLAWYAVKVFFNKVFEMEDYLLSLGCVPYVPVQAIRLMGAAHLAAARSLASLAPADSRKRRYIQEGPVIYVRKPLVASLVFVQATSAQMGRIDVALHGQGDPTPCRGFVYRRPEGKKEYEAIPERQMAAFRLVADSGVSGLEFFSSEDLTSYRQGDKVRVMEGPLKGAEGYIRRIRRDRRLLVSIQGIVAVATSYIPPEFLQKIEQ